MTRLQTILWPSHKQLLDRPQFSQFLGQSAKRIIFSLDLFTQQSFGLISKQLFLACASRKIILWPDNKTISCNQFCMCATYKHNNYYIAIVFTQQIYEQTNYKCLNAQMLTRIQMLKYTNTHSYTIPKMHKCSFTYKCNDLKSNNFHIMSFLASVFKRFLPFLVRRWKVFNHTSIFVTSVRLLKFLLSSGQNFIKKYKEIEFSAP